MGEKIKNALNKMHAIKYALKVGDWIEYSTSEWLQNTAGALANEIIEIISIDQDGGIAYESKSMHGHMGSEHVKKYVKPLKKGSVLTYWKWEKSIYQNEYSVSLKKHQSTILSISGSIAMIELFNGVRVQVDLRDLIFDSKMINSNYFVSNIQKQFEEA